MNQIYLKNLIFKTKRSFVKNNFGVRPPKCIFLLVKQKKQG